MRGLTRISLFVVYVLAMFAPRLAAADEPGAEEPPAASEPAEGSETGHAVEDEAPSEEEEGEESEGESERVPRGPRDPSYVGAPIPMFNPTLEFGIGLLGMASYQVDPDDHVSPPSSTMIFGMYATTGTWFVAAAQALYLREDDWRVKLGVGGGTVALEFFGIGNDLPQGSPAIPFNQGTFFGAAGASRRVWSRLYAGMLYRGMWTDTYTDPDDDFPDFSETVVSSGVGLNLSWDSRDNQFSATDGYNAVFRTVHPRQWMGSDNDYDIFQFFVNAFLPLKGPKYVLALRGNMRFTHGDVPFFDLSVMGQGPDLRGYQAGEYRDNALMDVQAEFRWEFWWRFGLVAFIGVGGVAEDFVSFFGESQPLPSAGAGLRFDLVPEKRIKLRIDYARGLDENTVYFSVNEAF